MRRLSFYPKLAVSNIWRNRKTYFPYMLACVVSVFTFYTLLAINVNGALDGIRGESIVKAFTTIGTFILAIFCSALIFYTNSFLIKRRKKELGLYSILGMEKKNIAVLMLYETLLVAAVTLVLGVLTGMLLGQLLFWALLRMIRFDTMMAMPLSPLAVGVTFILFGVVFLLALLTNLRQVHIANPVRLLAGAKEGEREPKASWLLTLTGVLCLAGGYFAALYFTSPMTVLMMFLLAIALVIAGTYCLFTSGSIAMLKLMRKNKKYYYRPAHFISVSGMIYRMKQNAAGLSTICILSCMVLVTVSSTVSMNVGAEDSLSHQYPYDYEILARAEEDAEAIWDGIQAGARESGAELVNVKNVRPVIFTAVEQDGAFAASDDFTNALMPDYFELITLEDYNRNENTHAVLAPGEALLMVTGGRYTREELTLNGFTYAIRPLEKWGKRVPGGGDITRTFTLVLAGSAEVYAAAGIEDPAGRSGFRAHIAFDLAGAPEARQAFDAAFDNFVNGFVTPHHFQWHDREENRADWYATNGGFLFLGIYFGVIFMLAAALIIYYKQMSEGYDDAERFAILQKVGMGEAEVKKTINKQILAVFFIPLLAAAVHVTVAFFPISRVMILFGVLNIPLLAVTTAATVLVYALVYFLVFRQTARTYFGIVRRPAAA